MHDVEAILDEVYVGDERVSRDEIYRRAVAIDAPAEVVIMLDALPEGEYAQDEAAEAVRQLAGSKATADPEIRTGAEQPWDPEDLAVGEGHDPSPANVERARRELDEDGPAAVERTVP